MLDDGDWSFWQQRFVDVVAHEGVARDTLLPALMRAIEVADPNRRRRLTAALPEILTEYADAWRERPGSVTLDHLDAALKLQQRPTVGVDLGLDEIWKHHLTRVDLLLSPPRELSRPEIDALVAFVNVTGLLRDHRPDALDAAGWPRRPPGLQDRLVDALYATTVELPSQSTEVDAPDWRLGVDLRAIIDFSFRYGKGDLERLEEAQGFLDNYETAYRRFERDEEQSAEPPPEPPARVVGADLPFDLGRVFSDL